MKKILILSSDSHYIYNTKIELIEKLISMNFEVCVVAPNPLNDEKVKLLKNTGANYKQIYLNRRGMNIFEDIKFIRGIKDIIENISPDIILTFTIKPNIYGSYVGNKFNIPVIINITGLGTSLVTGKFKFLIKIMYKHASSIAKKVFFQNKSNLNFFLKNNLVKKSKTKIIPGSGVNTDKFIPMEKTTEKNKTKFLFIGRLMKDKGIDDYLSVAKKVTKENPDIEFLILGQFEELKYKKIIENNTNKQIKYLGVSNDVRNEIKEVDCIVNPSYHEGMSNVLLEGGAMGKFLIASDIPGCREIIDEGKNGLLFKSGSIEDLEKKILMFLKLKKKDDFKVPKDSINMIKEKFDRKIITNNYISSIKNILN